MTILFRNLKNSLLALILITGVAATTQADSLSIDFESMPLGSLPGGADARTPGDDSTWWVPDNAATSGEVRAGVGLGGSNGLVVGNRGNGFDGVIDNVKSPRLAEAAGESVAPVFAPNSTFISSYWFRTAADSQYDGFAFKSETIGPDRTTYFGAFYQTVFGDTSLNAGAYSIEDIGGGVYDFVWAPIASNLTWGEWYNVVTEVTFVDGADNDVVNHYLYDASNLLVGSATNIGSWEEGARQFGYNGGNVFGVDAVQFQARGATLNNVVTNHDVAFVDNLSYSVVPEPATVALVGMGLASFFVVRRRSRG